MESDVRPGLYRDLEDWGYSLLRPQDTADPANLLKEIAQVEDARLLEGFPVVLSSWLLKKPDVAPPLAEIEEGIASAGDKKRFRLLVGITWQLMLMLPDASSAREKLRNYLEKRDPNVTADVRKAFAEGKPLNAGRTKLSPERLQTTFSNYVLAAQKHERERLSERIERAREMAFNEALNDLFSERQIEIIQKVLAREALTKTEREYYSRVIKKRMAAIANPDLHTLAASVLGRQDIFVRSQMKADEDT